jgi:hypothetical protein
VCWSRLIDCLNLGLFRGSNGVLFSLALLRWCLLLIFARVIRIVGVLFIFFLVAAVRGVGAVVIIIIFFFFFFGFLP